MSICALILKICQLIAVAYPKNEIDIPHRVHAGLRLTVLFTLFQIQHRLHLLGIYRMNANRPSLLTANTVRQHHFRNAGSDCRKASVFVRLNDTAVPRRYRILIGRFGII